jgi:hypothetical protein
MCGHRLASPGPCSGRSSIVPRHSGRNEGLFRLRTFCLLRPLPYLARARYKVPVTGRYKSSNGLCGRRTRRGTSCRAMAVRKGMPCKLHGGLSTGPKSIAGKMRALRNFASYRDMPQSELETVAKRMLDARQTRGRLLIVKPRASVTGRGSKAKDELVRAEAATR